MSAIRTEYTKPLTPKETAMGKRYRLLKDLPGYRAGYVVETDDDGLTIMRGDDGSSDLFKPTSLPDWFAALDEPASPAGRWRAESALSYWFVNDKIIQEVDYDDRERLHEFRYKSGNYFRTREQAEAAAEAIRAVLGYIQTSEPRQDVDDILGPAKTAWQLIHDEENN